jgi:hypothetical protein
MIRVMERCRYFLRRLDTQFRALIDDLIQAGEASSQLSATLQSGAGVHEAFQILAERNSALDASWEATHELRRTSIDALRDALAEARGLGHAPPDPARD